MKTFVASALILGASLAQAATNHIVTLGAGGQLQFNPNQITATPGDTVTFQFLAGNHSVAQSTFAAPCVPIDGVWSGFEPVSAASAASSAAGSKATTTSSSGSSSGYSSGYKEKRQSGETPEYTITVNNTTPAWFYCAQAKHCQAGMVFAINVNATSNKTLSAFASLAAAAPSNIPPTFAPQGGVQSFASSTGGASSGGASSAVATAPASTGTTATFASAAVLSQQFAPAAMLVAAILAVFGGVVAVF